MLGFRKSKGKIRRGCCMLTVHLIILCHNPTDQCNDEGPMSYLGM